MGVQWAKRQVLRYESFNIAYESFNIANETNMDRILLKLDGPQDMCKSFLRFHLVHYDLTQDMCKSIS